MRFDDPKRASHRCRAHALLRRSVVGVALRHEQPRHVAAERFLLLGVGYRRAEHLRHVARHRLAAELQRRQRIVHVLAANKVQHEPGLLGRGAHVLGCGFSANHGLTLSRRRRWSTRGAGRGRCLVAARRMALELPRRRELAELVAHHVFSEIHRHELLAVVHRERVTDHLGHHGRTARPRLDDLASRSSDSSPRLVRRWVSTNGTFFSERAHVLPSAFSLLLPWAAKAGLKTASTYSAAER